MRVGVVLARVPEHCSLCSRGGLIVLVATSYDPGLCLYPILAQLLNNKARAEL